MFVGVASSLLTYHERPGPLKPLRREYNGSDRVLSCGPTQLPQLEAFLDYWPTDVRLAVEVRHSDFYRERDALLLNSLLSQHKVARVMMDTRPIRTGSTEEQQNLVYFEGM